MKEPSNWQLLSARTTVLVVVMLRRIQESETEHGIHDFDSSNLVDLHQRALNVAMKSLLGDKECMELVKQAHALYEQQNTEPYSGTKH